MNKTIQTDLHWLWDNDILMHRLHKHFSSDVEKYFNYLYSLMMNPSFAADMSSDTDYKAWIREDAEIVCSQIYFDDNNKSFNDSFDLNEPYFQRHYALIDKRIVLGGRRLGVFLRSLKPDLSSASCDSLHLNIIALIAVLCVEFIIGFNI